LDTLSDNEIMADSVKILNRMMRLCSMGEHCTGEIRSKLEKYEGIDADGILEKLCREGYIDDARFARAFARDKSSLYCWGTTKIRVALWRKGICEQDIEQALLEIDQQAADAKFLAAARTKWASLSKETDPQKKRAKFFRFALGRGYSYDKVLKAYDTVRTDKRD